MLVHADLIQGVGADVIDICVLLVVLLWVELLLLLHVLLLVLCAFTAHERLLLIKRSLALAALASRRVRHNALRLRDGLKSDSRGSCALTSHLVVVRHLLVELRSTGFRQRRGIELLVRVSLREARLLRVCHMKLMLLLQIVDQTALIDTLINAAEVMPHLDVVKRAITRAQQIVLSLLPVS